MRQTRKPTHGRILLVDDDQAHRNFLERGLRYEGYQVRLAAGGQEGLELALRDPPDLILLDILMPGMDGIAVARALREAGLHVPMVFISASDEPGPCGKPVCTSRWSSSAPATSPRPVSRLTPWGFPCWSSR